MTTPIDPGTYLRLLTAEAEAVQLRAECTHPFQDAYPGLNGTLITYCPSCEPLPPKWRFG